jgi:hypothetical protein
MKILKRKTNVLRENLAHCQLVITDSMWIGLDLNPGLSHCIGLLTKLKEQLLPNNWERHLFNL